VNRFAAECRAAVSGDRLVGHAAVFGVLADLPNHYEELARSAFDKRLDDDVRALVNHDPNLLLGRTKSGTLKLGVDDEGLHFEIDKLPDTTYGRDLREMLDRGDLDGMSFGFIPGEKEWARAPDGRRIQRHTSLELLLDISPVTFPAYEGTGVALRAMQWMGAPAVDRRSQLIRIRHTTRLEVR